MCRADTLAAGCEGAQGVQSFRKAFARPGHEPAKSGVVIKKNRLEQGISYAGADVQHDL